ncbi:MAG: hypothetical protein U1F83_20355, partial [Verrucomicrobiota bacterium]
NRIFLQHRLGQTGKVNHAPGFVFVTQTWMSCSLPELFTRWFTGLERENIPYVILHSYQDFPERVTTDVDYAVAPEALQRLPALEDQVAAECGWLVVQRLPHEIYAYSTILVNPEHPGEHLMLDVTTHYARNGSRLVPATELLAQRRRFKNFWIPHPAAEFIYLWAKTLAKFKEPQAQIPRLQELVAQAPEQCAIALKNLCGPEVGAPEDWFARPESAWRALGKQMHRLHRYSASQRWQEFRRVWGRLRQPTGLAIAFLGPDGAGKSTVITQVERWLLPAFRQSLHIHFNPRFDAHPSAPVSNPQGRPPRHLLVGWAKIFFYFGRHWLHWLLRQRPALIRTTLIIHDRNFEDMLVDPRRYRLRHAATLVGCLARCLPPPAVTLVLDAPGEIIHQRKAELSVAEIERQRQVLQALVATRKNWVLIPATAAAPEVATRAAREIYLRLAARNACRKSGLVQQWS